MKRLITLVSTLLLCYYAVAQTVVATRTSNLRPEGYSITGDAILEELDNGSLTLRLSDDFSTPRGPDVRIVLSNERSLANSIEIVNLTTINHFSGGRTFDVPANIEIDDYQFVLFYCVQFQLFWASGEFGVVENPGGNANCETSSVTTSGGAVNTDICPSDNNTDIVSFSNSISVPAGENYAYLITNENEILQEVVLNNSYDFEGSSDQTQRVYGIHYAGQLNSVIGSNRSETTATECFTHSTGYLAITKNACSSAFECSENLTATTNWATEVEICPSDGVADEVALKNNLFILPGDHYAYLITDENEIVQAVVQDTIYDFEGSGAANQRVYGIHFDGELNVVIGQNRLQTTATGCFTHSGSNLFLTIKKTACPAFECSENLTATTNWATEVEICPSDGVADEVALKNNLFILPGDHYAYLITDENEIVQAVVQDTIYDFEGSGAANQRVYGIHFDGELNVVIGQNRLQTTATGCFTHSGSNLFLTIKKTACPAYECRESLTATYAWVINVDICSTDGQADEVFLQNNIQTPPGDHYAFLLTDKNEILQEVILDTVYNFENTGVEEQRIYGLSYAGTLIPDIGTHRKNTTASECFIHSGDNLFITINKTAACVTSVLDVELAKQVNIYPNPVSSTLNIKVPTEFVPEQVTIINTLGNTLFSENISSINNIEVDVTNLNSGNYMVRLENSEQVITRIIQVIK